MKNKGFTGKWGASQKTLNALIRAADGGTSGPIGARIRSAFATLGRPCPASVDLRDHIMANAAFVIQTARPFRAPSHTEVARTRIAGAPAASDAFLESYEWRRVRMQALKRYGPRCQCCGATPADGAVMNVDHIKPRRLFPALALDIENLQILCHECNHGKGNWDMTDWRTAEPTEEPEGLDHLRSISRDGL
jgi:5-methylcytosine-specific restriction endonuclease McrA